MAKLPARIFAKDLAELEGVSVETARRILKATEAKSPSIVHRSGSGLKKSKRYITAATYRRGITGETLADRLAEDQGVARMAALALAWVKTERPAMIEKLDELQRDLDSLAHTVQALKGRLEVLERAPTSRSRTVTNGQKRQVEPK